MLLERGEILRKRATIDNRRIRIVDHDVGRRQAGLKIARRVQLREDSSDQRAHDERRQQPMTCEKVGHQKELPED